MLKHLGRSILIFVMCFEMHQEFRGIDGWRIEGIKGRTCSKDYMMLTVESKRWAAASRVSNLNINQHQKDSINLLLKLLFSGKSFRLCNPRRRCLSLLTWQNLPLRTESFEAASDDKDMIPDSVLMRAFLQVCSNALATGSLLNAS